MLVGLSSHTTRHPSATLQLTFYLEACESGSMFEGVLADDVNIYATTAANPGAC